MPQIASPVGSNKAPMPSTWASLSAVLMAIPILASSWHGNASLVDPTFYSTVGSVLAGVVGLFLKNPASKVAPNA